MDAAENINPSNNNAPLATTKDLVEFLSSKFQRQQVIRDTSHYRYVIYARKSTENAEKQVRSLSDQVIECKQLAEEENLKIYNGGTGGLPPKADKLLAPPHINN